MPRVSRPQAPPPDSPFSPDEQAQAQAGIEQLAGPLSTLAWCHAVGVPVDAADAECDSLRRFFEALGARLPDGAVDAARGCPLDHDDLRRVEEEFQRLAVPSSTIDWCKRKGIPVDGAAAECAALHDFFSKILAHSKGQQGRLTGAP